MLKALSTKDDVHFPVTTDLFLEILVLDTEARGFGSSIAIPAARLYLAQAAQLK